MFRSPLFAWSPRPDQDLEAFPASQSPSRFGSFRNNLRSMYNSSSIYSQSPALPAHNATPKIPFLGFLSRQNSPNPNEFSLRNDLSRDSNESRSPLQPQHTAGSYIRTIAPLQDPQEPETVYSRHPADVVLPHQNDGFADPEIQQLADEINGRRHRRRKHRRRKHHHAPRSEQWVRRRGERSIYVKGTLARGKLIACILSGIFLLTVLAVYLAIALRDRNLGQEIHILFIMVLLTITIFFCHSLIRLCMLLLNPPREEHHPQLAAMTGPDGFQPIVPIRVHLARDEEAARLEEHEHIDLETDDPEKLPPPPPPAYGLWRSSVRVDPNLLHWQRIGDQRASVITDTARPHGGSVSGPGVFPSARTAAQASTMSDGPRPPSYVSEDGVSYITEAAPQSRVRMSTAGASDVHPAWRTGYAMSEIRPGELPQRF
ncbi:hypothetical protein ACN47E_002251 [Coniothyrium glycines]